MTKKSRQVRRALEREKEKNPKMNYSKGPNRKTRRGMNAFERHYPQILKKIKISNNLRDTKKAGRIAKQKHIDEVKARTAKRKELKKKNKGIK